MTKEIAIALTTLPSREEADSIAADAIAGGFATCAQVEGPCRSHYAWKGKVESEEEYRITFKCALAKVADLEAWVHAQHPFVVPQWLVFKVDFSSPAYRAWVLGER